MTNLSININKIAWLRNARDGDIPNLVNMTMNIIDSGCHGITVHPRPDLRHITPKDVAEIKKIIPSNIEFNIEGNPFEQPNDEYPGYMELINFYQPDQATLVPDDTMQKTSDHGFDLSKPNLELEKIIKTFIHGFLHLLGFDHVKNKDYLKMLKEEEKIYKSVISKIK